MLLHQVLVYAIQSRGQKSTFVIQYVKKMAWGTFCTSYKELKRNISGSSAEVKKKKTIEKKSFDLKNLVLTNRFSGSVETVSKNSP